MPSSLLEQAIEARAEGRYDEAHQYLQALLTSNPQDAQANYQMAWLHDTQGKEREAVPYYEEAIQGDLPEDDLRGALLGLGSTLRTLGAYEQSISILRQGMTRFPDAGEFPVFLAMALYNVGQHEEAMAHLLRVAATTSADEGILRYQRAILFYHDKLNQQWS